MIPPVEVRQIRPCKTCVFSQFPVMMKCWSKPKAKCALNQWKVRDGGSCCRYWWNECKEQLKLPAMACKYHLTARELQTLIDTGVIR